MDLLSAEEKESLKCGECGQSFESTRDLKVHKNKAHSTTASEDPSMKEETSDTGSNTIQPVNADVDNLVGQFQSVEKHVQDLKTSNQRTATKVESLEERINSYNERIDVISDRLGSTRENAKENAKRLTKIQSKSEKALDLVEQIEPQKIKKKIESRDAKIDQANNEIQQTRTQLKDLRESLSNLRETVRNFEGIDQIKDLKKEVREDLQEAKQKEEKIDIKANQVEDMFLEMEEKVSEIKKIDEAQKGLEDQFHELRKLFDDVQIKVDDLPEKQEFEEFKEDIAERTEELEAIQPLIEKSVESTGEEKDVTFITESDFQDMKENISRLRERLKKELQLLVDEPSDTETSQYMNDHMRSHFISIYEDIADIKKQVSEDIEGDLGGIKERIDHLESAVEHMQVQDGTRSIWIYVKDKILSFFGSQHKGTDFASHPCEFCSEAFDDQTSLRKHRLQAHKGKALICTDCGKLCDSKKSLERHKIRAHD